MEYRCPFFSLLGVSPLGRKDENCVEINSCPAVSATSSPSRDGGLSLRVLNEVIFPTLIFLLKKLDSIEMIQNRTLIHYPTVVAPTSSAAATTASEKNWRPRQETFASLLPPKTGARSRDGSHSTVLSRNFLRPSDPLDFSAEKEVQTTHDLIFLCLFSALKLWHCDLTHCSLR